MNPLWMFHLELWAVVWYPLMLWAWRSLNAAILIILGCCASGRGTSLEVRAHPTATGLWRRVRPGCPRARCPCRARTAGDR